MAQNSPNPTNKETVRERLNTSDLIPRIACVVIAIIIWLYVMSNNSPDYERTFSGVPVTIENAAVLSAEKNLSVIGGYGSLADITITGKKGDVIAYSLEDITASVDIGNLQSAGKQPVGVSVKVPDGCIVKSVNPTSVEVYVDEIVSKQVPVKVDYVAEWDNSVSIGVPVPDVSTVLISGPVTVVNTAAYAGVKLTLGKITKSVNARGDLAVYTADGAPADNPYLTISQSSVGVSIPVYVEKEVPLKVAMRYGYLDESNSVVTVSPASVTVRADPTLLESADAFVVATLDETKLADDTTQTVTITLPDGVENVSGVSTAKITVRHKNTVRKTFAVTQIELQNPNGLNYTLLTESVNVTVRLPVSIADSVAAEDIRLIGELNYSGVTGNLHIPLTVRVPEEYAGTVYPIGDYAVSVKVEK